MTLPILALAALAIHFFRKDASPLGVAALAVGGSVWVGLSRGDIFTNLAILLAVGYVLALATVAIVLPWWLTFVTAVALGMFTIGNPSMLGCFAVVATACLPLPRSSKALCLALLALGAFFLPALPTQPLVLVYLGILCLYPMRTFLVTLAGVGWTSVFPLTSWLASPGEGWLNSNGRGDMWAKALQQWPGMGVWQGAFFGSGPGTARMILPSLSADPLHPFVYMHSDWLEALLTMGIVGFSACAMLYLLSLIKALEQDEPGEALPLLLFGAAMVANYPWHEPGFALLGAGLVVKVWSDRGKP